MLCATSIINVWTWRAIVASEEPWPGTSFLKNISFLLIVIISWCFFSCKSEQKSIYQEKIKSEIIDSVKINFKVLENDNRIKKINSFFQRK